MVKNRRLLSYSAVLAPVLVFSLVGCSSEEDAEWDNKLEQIEKDAQEIKDKQEEREASREEEEAELEAWVATLPDVDELVTEEEKQHLFDVTLEECWNDNPCEMSSWVENNFSAEFYVGEPEYLIRANYEWVSDDTTEAANKLKAVLIDLSTAVPESLEDYSGALVISPGDALTEDEFNKVLDDLNLEEISDQLQGTNVAGEYDYYTSDEGEAIVSVESFKKLNG